jgi:hypothetical protein
LNDLEQFLTLHFGQAAAKLYFLFIAKNHQPPTAPAPNVVG